MMVASSTMPPIKVPANLPDLVKSAFNRARASGDVNFYPTQVALLTVNSLPFQLRFSPSLANKPRNPLPPPPICASPTPAAPPAQKKFFNPFENPLPSMFVGTVEPAHNLVLNKFAVVPEHFILATKDFRLQTHLLEEEDLHAAWACIEAYRNQGQELYVFFNSGGHSGASQPHRHLQLLPVGRMRDGLDTLSETQMDTTAEAQTGIKWEILANGLVDEGTRKKLPFRTYARRINPSPSPELSYLDKRVDLKAIYLDLYSEACQAALGKDMEIQTGGEAKISYNLALTGEVMVLVPRLAEGGLVVSREGETVGKIALNGTVLAGTALVKSEEEWDALRQDPVQLERILGGIGIPWQQQTQSQALKEAPLL